MDPTTKQKEQPKPECACTYRMLRGVETRIVNPRCPLHGWRGHLSIVK